jgi:hypothetical protein
MVELLSNISIICLVKSSRYVRLDLRSKLRYELGIKSQMERRAYEGEGCYLRERRLTLYGKG